ncbi:MAG TPA: glycosyltransferase, partial [Thermoanaerobaculia bacterium]|nr:glycosyltransferase [Thermoanaerobaculia bacterium]
LVEIGGHNPIEAWARGVPTAVGPHVANVRAIVADGEAAGAAIPVRSADELAAAWASLLSNDERRRAASAAAERLVARHRGAARRTAQSVVPLRIHA